MSPCKPPAGNRSCRITAPPKAGAALQLLSGRRRSRHALVPGATLGGPLHLGCLKRCAVVGGHKRQVLRGAPATPPAWDVAALFWTCCCRSSSAQKGTETP